MEKCFATEKEIKKRCIAVPKNKKATACGPTLFSDEFADYVVAEEGHTMCFGGTGSGKTTRILLPAIEKIARCQEGLLIVDPKPGLICRTQNLLQQNGYQIYYLNFVDYWKSQRYNLLGRVQRLYEKGDKAETIKVLDEIATALFKPHINAKDPYWGMNGRDLLVGAGMALLDSGADLTFENINVLLMQGKESFSTSNYLNEYVNERGPHSEAAMRLTARALAPHDTAACIDSVASTVLNPFVMDGLADMMSESDFSFAQLAEGKTAIFIITPADDSCMEAYVGLLVKAAYDELKEQAIKNENGRLPKTVHFVIDEFCNFPIPSVERMITLARGYNERFYLGIQNYGSLSAKYGSDAASTIWANSEIKFILRSSDIQLGELLEKLCGARIDPITGAQRPLIGVTDIQRLDKPSGEAVVLVDGIRPFVTHFQSIYDHAWDYPYFSIDTLERRKEKKRKYFDFQEKVKEMKRNKLFAAVGISPGPIRKPEVKSKPKNEDPEVRCPSCENMLHSIDEEFARIFDLESELQDQEDGPLP